MLHVDSCVFYNNSARAEGGSIHLEKNVTATIVNSLFTHNEADGGAALLLAWNVSAHVNHCVFMANVNKKNAGIISVLKNATLHINNSVITNNECGLGTILFGNNITFIHIGRSSIIHNKGVGIVLSSMNSNLRIRSCQMNHNNGYTFVISSTNGKLFMIDSDFENNTSSDGGGVFTTSSSVMIRTCHFRNNRAGTKGGVGVFQSPSTAIILNSTFSYNQAQQEGGGIKCYGDSLELYNCNLSNNVAGQGGSGQGGAIYVSTEGTRFKASNVTFTQNKATNADGGAVLIHDPRIDTVIDNCNFWNNSADEGGTAIAIGTNLIRIASTVMSEPTRKRILSYTLVPALQAMMYTYKSTVTYGNTTLNTDQQTFLSDMKKMGLIQIPENVNVTQKETEFASGKVWAWYPCRVTTLNQPNPTEKFG